MFADSKSFTTKYTGQANKLINDVGIAQPFADDQHRPAGFKTYKALWDTGATNSLITERVVREGGFAPLGFVQIGTASGLHTSPTFFVSIWLPNMIAVRQVRVTQGDLVGGIDLLIGMDIIGLGDFAVNSQGGWTSFSFRIPSLEHIDYTLTQQTLRMAKPAVGRNDPCPCGSGKKYKNCHGRT